MDDCIKRTYLSASALKAFAKSPNHYIQYVMGATETTPAMTFGSAFHCYVLEPEEFNKRYAVSPLCDRRTKEGKMLYAKFVEASEGLEVLTAQDYALILEMDKAISEHKPAFKLLGSCNQFEQLKDGKIADVNFKGIADGMGDGFIVDLKTCQDASPEAFERTAYNSFYHEQAAAYMELFGADRFYWIAIEKNPPYNVAVYMQSQEAFFKAQHRLKSLIQQWDEWDGKPMSYSDNVFMLNLPKWAK
jgi:exodeoxyribonuclease VIII